MRFYIFLFLLLPFGFAEMTLAQNRRNEKINEEEIFISNNFPLHAPVKWKPGEQFIYVDSALNITLKPEQPILNDTTNYKNTSFTFAGIKEQTDWNGNSTLDFIFEANNRKYKFESGKSLIQFSDSTYNPLIAGLIWFPEIQKADSLLAGKTLYILSSEWQSPNDNLLKYARKFVPVKITNVIPGTAYIPVTILFQDQEGRNYSIGVTLSGTLNTSSRYKFSRIFSFNNPREKYKEIEDSTWTLITEGKLTNGMTQQEVRLSIGKPSEINRIPTYSGLREQWLYNNGTMIQFQDGRIVSFRK